MRKKTPLILTALLFSLKIWAQCSISGIVTDSTKAPVQFAAIALMNPTDSSIIKSTLTNEKGEFIFDSLSKGSYLVKVSAMGYSAQFSNLLNIDAAQSHQKISLVLKSHGTTLSVINISADKPFVEHKIDMNVYNIGSDDLMSGRNGNEVLQNIPGIMDPDNGNITVAGKTGITILIDGRPTYLSGQDVNEYLKSFDASQIERVEVITNPSAKYDASGGAVINIVLKKNAKIGFHGNISLTDNQSYYNTQNGSINGSYRTKQWNIYGSAGTNASHGYGTSELTRDFTDMLPQQLFDESDRHANTGTNYSGRLGIDYMPDNFNSIGVSANGYYSTYSGYNNNYTSIFNQSAYADSATYTKQTNGSSNRHTSENIDYTYKVDSTGKEFSVYAGYGTQDNSPFQQNSIYYYDSIGYYLHTPSYLNLQNPIVTTTKNAQADYVLPINTSSKLETGIKAVSTETDNNSQYWDNEQGEEVLDTTRSNHFNFTESIFSGYGKYTGKVSKKVSYGVGVRVENTEDKGIQYVHDSVFTRNYTDVFPNGNVYWSVDSSSSLNAYYREGINRPGYYQLNPFLQYATPYSFYTGNINLQPSFYYTYGLSYSFKSLLGATFEYSHSDNVIQSIWEQNSETHISYYIPLNIASGDNYYLSFDSYVHVAKWWTMMNYYNVHYSTYNGPIDGTSYANSSFSWYVYSNNTFTITKQWKGEITFSYNSPTAYGFTTNQSWYNMNAAISKKIAKDRGVIKAGSYNILSPFASVSSQNIQGINVHTVSYWYPQTMYVSLSWKLGKVKQG